MVSLFLAFSILVEVSSCPHIILHGERRLPSRAQVHLGLNSTFHDMTHQNAQNETQDNSSPPRNLTEDITGAQSIGNLSGEQIPNSLGQSFDDAAGISSDCSDIGVSQPEVPKSVDSGKVLDVTGLFALTGEYRAGLAYLAAAVIAVKVINQRPDILPGYTIRINAHDTQCSEPHGLDAFYEEVYNRNRTSIMTMGGTCSHVTEATAQVSHLWGIPEISYSAVSPYLSNQDKFPSFFRVMSPEQYLTSARIKLFKTFGWKKVHTIYQNYFLFSTLDESMRQEMAAVGIEVISSGQIFTDDPTPNVRTLMERDARIILASMYEDKLRITMCTAYHLAKNDRNRTHPWYKRVVWLLPSFIDRHWMNRTTGITNCTRAQIMEVAGNYFSIGSTVFSRTPGYKAEGGFDPAQFAENYTGVNLYEAAADMIPERFQHLYREVLDQSQGEALPSEHRAGQAYDCMWAIALALNNTMTYFLQTGDNRTLEHFSYRDWNFSSILHQAMMNVSFNALSGPFIFNAKGEKSPVIDIMRFNNTHNCRYDWLGQCVCAIGEIDVCNCSLDEKKIHWENGIAPVDGVQTVERVIQVCPSLKYVFRALASLGILLSIILLAFNILNRAHRIIKMSSPRLNNVILLGCVLAYCNVLLMEVNVDPMVPMCDIRAFTIMLSFSLSFGALFAKTWRVYQIFTAGSALKRLSTKMLRDSSLFLIVLALVTVNSLILVAWCVVSPQKTALLQIGTTPADVLTDMEYVNLHQRCDSRYKSEFTWALLALQGVVILAGTFLAVQTRKVSCPELNDSKWIGVCIYHVVILCPLGVVVIMATENSPDTSYALEASISILVTTMTQCLIFMPKIFAYRKHNHLQLSQPDGRLNLHKGSIANSRHSDTLTSAASTRSITPSTYTHLKYGFQVDGSDALSTAMCPKCHCHLNQEVFHVVSSHADLQRKSTYKPPRAGYQAGDTRPEEPQHKEYHPPCFSLALQRQRLDASACSFCRLPIAADITAKLAESRRSSDSNLSRYMLRRYTSME